MATSWLPTHCALPAIDEASLCEALSSSKVNRILLTGDSALRNMFVVLIREVLPPRDGTGDTPLFAPPESRSYYPSWWKGAGISLATRRHIDYCRQHVDAGSATAPPACREALRCGGSVHLRFMKLFDPYTRVGVRQSPDSMLVASNPVATRPLPFDVTVADPGQHYLKGFAPGVPQANLTTAFALDLSALLEMLASWSKPEATHVVMSQPRPYPPRKPPRWQDQSRCVVEGVNAIERELISGRPSVSLLDGFWLTRGLEEKHCYDGTHYDAAVLAATAATLLQVMAIPRQPQHGVELAAAAAAPDVSSGNDKKGALARAMALARHPEALCERDQSRSKEDARQLPAATQAQEAVVPKQETSFASSEITACGTPFPPTIASLREQARLSGLLSSRRLIINPGEGTSGTTVLGNYAECCGLRVLHWNGLSRQLAWLGPRHYGGLNLSSKFADLDYVSDTPINAMFPYILAAFPEAVVLHSTRVTSAWVHSRNANHPTASRAMSWLFSRGQTDPTYAFSRGDADGAPTGRDALAYDAHNSFVRCMVPRERYLEVPLSHLCEPGLQADIHRVLRSTCRGCRMGQCEKRE